MKKPAPCKNRIQFGKSKTHAHTHNGKLIITVRAYSMGQQVSKYLCIKVSCKMKECV